MKNTISFLVFTLFALCTYAQNSKNKSVSKTIIVYDTITVYDTIFVYDTIKTENKAPSENNFKNNFTTEKAYLAIDTSDFSAAVLLINKKDTATLSINSIILSETNKNLDTMKKSLLTLLVSAALTQAAKSQESVNTAPKVEDVFPKYTLSVGGTMAVWTVKYAQLYGVNFKADKVIGKKGEMLLGISSDLGGIHKKKHSGTHVQEGVVRGGLGNLFFNFTYYLIGNASKDKNALYITTGLGGVLFNAYQTDTYNNGDGDFVQIKEQYYGFNVGQNFGLGAEWKLGQGKIYTELLVAWNVVERSRIKVQDSFASNTYENLNSVFDNPRIIWGDRGLIETPMVRIGYKFNF